MKMIKPKEEWLGLTSKLKLYHNNKKYWIYIDDFWPEPIKTYHQLKEELTFEQGKVFVFGKWYDERRLTCFYGTKSYTYSCLLHSIIQLLIVVIFS